ncbi:MAG: elongation factor P maturation arginine rhamnosyltransferase EarP [Proteobacteria bacterium]|nr:elongation factor P maturation arginine rhamnosyltransferase EarP [Pseudomonadota bacterium]
MRGKNWDIFCTVVDNFGDIGVCWRLARQLAAEHNMQVRLWVDDLYSLHRFCPEIQVSSEEQAQRGVLVRHWVTPFPRSEIADVVIEAFACELPDSYLAAMAESPRKPVWINLEYLSAQDWVGNCHGLPSPHPSLPLTKYFFFPGFVEKSGGLLREARLVQRRDACRAEPAAGWHGLGLPPSGPEETSVSMFCYENPALPELLDAWAAGEVRVRCLIPEGKALIQTAAHLGHPPFQVGVSFQRGNLTLYALPFLSQDDYDRLLWLCDLNFVRGEDSFVRAQWAAQPMVWHIYSQQDAAHIAKLDAFLALYCETLPAPASLACRDFWMAWNRGEGATVAAAWQAFWRIQPDLKIHAAHWSRQLCGQADLAQQLVRFSENLL